MATLESEAKSHLRAQLVPKLVKKCFPGWKTTALTAVCGFCQVAVGTSGNTSNARSHLVNNHADLVTTFLSRELKQSSSAVKKRPNSSGLTLDQEEEEDDPGPPSKKSKIADYLSVTSKSQPDQASTRSSAQASFRQATLDECLEAAKQSPKGAKNERLQHFAISRLLVRAGALLPTMTTFELEPLKQLFPRGKVPSPKELVESTMERLEFLLPFVVETLNSCAHWTIDLQTALLTSNTHIAAAFAVFLDSNFQVQSPCVAVFLVSTIDGSEPCSIELAARLSEELGTLGLTLTSVKAALSFSNATNEATTKLFRNVPVVECFLSKISQLLDDLWSNAEISATMSSVNAFMAFITSKNQADWLNQQMECLGIVNNEFESYSKCFSNQDRVRFVSENSKNLKGLLLANELENAPLLTYLDISVCSEFSQLVSIVDVSKKAANEKNPFLLSDVCTYMHLTKKKLLSMKPVTVIAKAARDTAVLKLDAWLVKRIKSDVHSSAMFMDPRVKASLHVSEPLAYSSTLKSLVENLKRLSPDDEQDSNSEPDEERPEENFESLLSSFNMSDFTEKRGGHSKIDVETANLKLYLNDLEVLGSSADPGQFWKNRAQAEPLLAKLALKKLSLPGKRLVHLSKMTQSKYFIRQTPSEMLSAIFFASISEDLLGIK